MVQCDVISKNKCMLVIRLWFTLFCCCYYCVFEFHYVIPCAVVSFEFHKFMRPYLKQEKAISCSLSTSVKWYRQKLLFNENRGNHIIHSILKIPWKNQPWSYCIQIVSHYDEVYHFGISQLIFQTYYKRQSISIEE